MFIFMFRRLYVKLSGMIAPDKKAAKSFLACRSSCWSDSRVRPEVLAWPFRNAAQ